MWPVWIYSIPLWRLLLSNGGEVNPDEVNSSAYSDKSKNFKAKQPNKMPIKRGMLGKLF